MTEASLARQQTIRDVVTVYEEQVTRLRACYATMADIQQKLSEQFAGDGVTLAVGRKRERHDWSEESLAEGIRHIDVQVWRRLVDKLEVRRFLSIRKARELDEAIEKHAMPPITYENVMGLLLTFQQQGQEFAKEAVREVFERLRVRCSKLKTNSEFEVGPKVILPLAVEYRPWSGKAGVRSFSEQDLRALENVFHLLDGKAARNRDHYSAAQQAIEAVPFGETTETELFVLRAFANGNLHVTFKRPDLVAKLNQVAGGKRLRGERRRRAP